MYIFIYLFIYLFLHIYIYIYIYIYINICLLPGLDFACTVGFHASAVVVVRSLTVAALTKRKFVVHAGWVMIDAPVGNVPPPRFWQVCLTMIIRAVLSGRQTRIVTIVKTSMCG